ncbi:kinase-like protein [Phanerochaete sordida]|uniref:Kinase-like protein n=1 Tax=Phanerochaete sordida TaxID=48140 RepID=A0A9P3GBI5_9APHY|nr:kinase-like protein [Phanerochaete sordida]
MGAILAPLLNDPREAAGGISLSKSERDAILERSFNLVLEMVDAARQHDVTLQVAGVALTRAQFNVLFAEVNRAIKGFAVRNGLRVLDVQDLGTALQVCGWQIAGTHWTDVHQGSFCVAIKEYRRLPSRDAKKAMDRIIPVLKSWSGCKLYDHPNINVIVGVNNKALMGFAEATEWAENRCIRIYTVDHPEVLDADVYKLLAEAAEGIIHLHENDVIHGNMKGSNILISEDGHALVTDYGLSRIILAAERELKIPAWAIERDSYYCRWRAPEASDYHAPTIASDVWEFGMTILEVLTGTNPYPEIRSDNGVCVTVGWPGYSGPKRPVCDQISDELWAAMQRCWHNKPEDRTTMAAIRDALRREEQQRRERPADKIPMEI